MLQAYTPGWTIALYSATWPFLQFSSLNRLMRQMCSSREIRPGKVCEARSCSLAAAAGVHVSPVMEDWEGLIISRCFADNGSELHKRSLQKEFYCQVPFAQWIIFLYHTELICNYL